MESKNVITVKNNEVISSNVSKEVAKTLAKKESKKTSSKKESKKTSSKKSEKKEETKNLTLNDILGQMNTISLKSNSGLKKENIYKKSIFSECITDKDKKTVRRKIRNVIDNFIGSILREKDSTKLKKVCKDFITFYENVYAINDFSISSIISANTDEIKKENLQKVLDIVKKNK